MEEWKGGRDIEQEEWKGGKRHRAGRIWKHGRVEGREAVVLDPLFHPSTLPILHSSYDVTREDNYGG
jgi:hypothetical protein